VAVLKGTKKISDFEIKTPRNKKSQFRVMTKSSSVLGEIDMIQNTVT